MTIGYGVFLSCPTDNSRRGPTEDLVGNESNIYSREYK